jgi:hypothetical protein
VVVNTIVILDYRMDKKMKNQVGSAGSSGRLQHSKPRGIHGKTRGEILKRKGKNVKKVIPKKIPPCPWTVADTTLFSEAVHYPRICLTLINTQIESGPRNLSKNRVLKETHSGKTDFPSTLLINVSLSTLDTEEATCPCPTYEGTAWWTP